MGDSRRLESCCHSFCVAAIPWPNICKHMLNHPTLVPVSFLQAERVSICSIEKANGAINRMIQEQRLHELVSVTIDEAHMLADPNR